MSTTKLSPPDPRPNTPQAGWYQRLFARFVANSRGRIDERLAPYKRELLGDLSGTVLEIGPGTGANLPYLAPTVRYLGIEPNPYMHDYLQAEAAQLRLTLELRQGVAEHLDVADASMDAVICTHVLCSVADPAQALREVVRVLKPGGRFVFIEHVAAPAGTWLRRLQDLIQRPWTCVGDGCHPNRETWRILESAGFATVDMRHFDIGTLPVGPHIWGVAVK